MIKPVKIKAKTAGSIRVSKDSNMIRAAAKEISDMYYRGITKIILQDFIKKKD